MDTFDKQFKRAMNDVKRGLKNLKKLKLKIEAHTTETMTGAIVQHGYVIDRIGDRTILQKHLFTIYETGNIE